ncbi:Os10g0202501 [Oryza sativa Japonica Group]|uniref:Os10g0202501 protein n=1 Tax=Oryza sativa subsp. japonica TaxID=39947 RepID=A0A0P0XSK7_ORYSJ|nr:hypothetical protein EE612_050524 [Oryza sativa]KAF2912927.1 hypothetical protein DAI22_10g049600 [Oryza sativa Japonica Group]BAT10239.1 Os10g0202501 [Oryza sativa Japonica Group]
MKWNIHFASSTHGLLYIMALAYAHIIFMGITHEYGIHTYYINGIHTYCINGRHTHMLGWLGHLLEIKKGVNVLPKPDLEKCSVPNKQQVKRTCAKELMPMALGAIR